MQINCKTVQIFFGDMQSVMTNDCIDIVHRYMFAVQVSHYMHITPSYLGIHAVNVRDE